MFEWHNDLSRSPFHPPPAHTPSLHLDNKGTAEVLSVVSISNQCHMWPWQSPWPLVTWLPQTMFLMRVQCLGIITLIAKRHALQVFIHVTNDVKDYYIQQGHISNTPDRHVIIPLICYLLQVCVRYFKNIKGHKRKTLHAFVSRIRHLIFLCHLFWRSL